MAPSAVGPLSLAEVKKLLGARYDRWRLRDDKPVRSPVESKAVDRLFEVFQGDLRGLLKALDDGVEECIGLGAVATSTESVVPPVALPDPARALQARYDAVMRGEFEAARIDRLELWLKADPEQAMTQQDLMGLWNVSQGTVSNALNTLVASGYVIVHPRQGRNAIQYALSGKARVIAGLA